MLPPALTVTGIDTVSPGFAVALPTPTDSPAAFAVIIDAAPSTAVDASTASVLENTFFFILNFFLSFLYL